MNIRPMSTYRRFLIPTGITVLLMAVLIFLGYWQVQRLHWKTGILAQLDAAEAAPPTPLPDVPLPFQKVVVTGTLVPSESILFGAETHVTQQGEPMGAQLLMPLSRAGHKAVMVQLGWVADPPGRNTPVPAGPVTITGYILPDQKKGWFTPPADPAHHHVYLHDSTTIAALSHAGDIEPYTLVALSPLSQENGHPIPAEGLPRPQNNHLGYALTWFGLAITLALLYVNWLKKALRS
ncbi:SURF1 family protein [Granulibacter bethesdensis]|uniref:SURF1 family protein n=1 Tax=Granulibacter bethesdensis TaxID=364410 RepID=UPI0003F1EE85|nr:SURF1 family protein [Granulibacter bethesdensis]AHJ65258.1 Cytochrome c oxidase assembly protein Surf1 [Granulibacter bethesdensis CGDNIH4]